MSAYLLSFIVKKGTKQTNAFMLAKHRLGFPSSLLDEGQQLYSVAIAIINDVLALSFGRG
jgi:hypothetical protein